MAQQPDPTSLPHRTAAGTRLWTWIVEHREWVFSGIGTALLMALLGYFLAQSGSDTVSITEPKGPAAIHTGTGDINMGSGEKR